MPLRVLWDAERQSWLIVTGESRWRAARIAGLTHLPCISVEGQPDEADLLADRIVENSCRNDLRPLDFARAIAKLKNLRRATSQQIAKDLGISGAAVTRAEALLTLPEDIQAMVDMGQVPESSAYELSRHPDPEAQLDLAHAVAGKRINRDAVAEAVRSKVGRKNVKSKDSRLVCRIDGGVSVSVSADRPLDWDTLLTALDRVRREAKKLCDGGKDITALAQALRAS
jgi:ParB family chromosome partitioning protein